MEIIKTKEELREYIKQPIGPISLVPTMGCLHKGHLQLIQEGKKNAFCLVSIFVNSLQFNNKEDYKNYPITLERDLELCKKNEVGCVFIPNEKEMYRDYPQLKLSIENLSKNLCGVNRPRHFEGVMMILLRLIHLSKPRYLFLGKKDYQQYKITKQMVSDLDIDITIVGVDTIRETDGLAYSSRNERLSNKGREGASLIYRALELGIQSFLKNSHSIEELKEIIEDIILSVSSNKIEYLEILDLDSLEKLESIDKKKSFLIGIAVFCDGIRLIDNIEYKAKENLN